MGIFDKVFKKKPAYDVTDLRVTDLKNKFVFDYDLSTWVVESEYEYDWGDECFSQEYKISDGKKTLFLSVEEDDEIELILSSKINIRDIDSDLPSYIKDNENPPKEVTYKGEEYYLDSENPGFFNDKAKGDKSWIEFISWDYRNQQNTKVINIEQWGDADFEASKGIVIQEFEISNICPA